MIPGKAHNSAASLAQMEAKIDELPLLPQVLVKLFQLNRQSEDYFDDFERLVKEDPTFAVRVIALANSSLSSPVSPITCIRDAITRMGAATISSLVSSLAVQRVFMPSKPGEIRLWVHSVYVACATEEVARMATGLKVDPGQAYLAGLLHDIGRFVMLEHAPEGLREVDESGWQTPDDLLAADLDVYRFTHSELGFLACKHWGLPEVICDVIREHHTDLPARIDPGSVAAINYCVQVADRLSLYCLEQDDVATQEGDYLLETVKQRCLPTVDGAQYVRAEYLASRASSIVSTGSSLLKSLGFKV